MEFAFFVVTALGGVLSVVGVVWVARRWASVSEARKREREQSVGPVSTLEPSAVASARESVTSRHAPDTLLADLEAMLRSQQARVPRRTDDEIVAFFGDANTSKVNGMLNTPPDAMPVRVAVRVSTVDGATRVEALVDEDYGFQMFAGPARTAFVEKYEAATAVWIERIRDLT
ncbi:MAG: hypothetical protein H6734_13035 [Alphaproteobacteria bacterium]|nr:hypothetical protein [Alphaproteobacteria bacterium]